MGVDLSVYRAAIGIFYLTTHRTVNQPNTFLNLSFKLHCTLAAFALLFARCFIKNDSFTAYRLILLLICMDIHPNPGPASSDSNGTSLDIFHLNAGSIRNKLEDIYSIAEEYHILCFSETHLDQSIDSSSLVLDGSGLPIRKDRSQHGGGVMIYISNLLVYKRRTELEDPRLEAIWIEITLKSQSVLICCSYRSDFNVSQALYISSMQSSIEMALDSCPSVVLVGLINIDCTTSLIRS